MPADLGQGHVHVVRAGQVEERRQQGGRGDIAGGDQGLETMQAGRFDAAFLAVGAHIAKRAYIPAGSAARMLDVRTGRYVEHAVVVVRGDRIESVGGGSVRV